ncbi:ABC transporter substrate-binding protein [Spirochaetia bacterium]|nr:ABC transporter substrate-binding protein [Spirochaetia bacterium]
MKKILCVALVLLCVGALLFAGGGQQGSGGGKTKIVFWHAMAARNGDAINRMVSAFNASQDKIEVEAQFQGGYSDAIIKVRGVPKGQGPDIMQLNDLTVRWAADSGLIHKMQDFINADKYDISDYEPNILAYYTLGGELYSMPFNVSVPVVIYNKEAVAKAGLDPKTAFATLDSCIASSQALKAAGMDAGFVFPDYSWMYEQMMAIQGKDIFDNGNGRQGRPTKIVNEDALLAIFTKYKTCVTDPTSKYYGKGPAVAVEQFNAGVVGAYMESCGIYENAYIAAAGKFSIGYAPLPKVNASDTGSTYASGGCLWLMDNGNDTKAKAAWEFIKFATSAEQQAIWSTGTGYIPIRKGAISQPVFQEYMKTKNPEIIVAIQNLQNAKVSSVGGLAGVYPEIREIFQNEVDVMASNPAVTPRQTVDRAVKQINDAITLYNRTN